MTFKLFIRLADREDFDQPAPFDLVKSLDWRTLKDLLGSYYYSDVTEHLDVRYWDEEDFVNVSSQEELEEAIRLAEEKSYLQLYVRLTGADGDATPDHQPVADSSDHSAGGEEGPVGKTLQKSDPESNTETDRDCIPSETLHTSNCLFDTSQQPLAVDSPEPSLDDLKKDPFKLVSFIKANALKKGMIRKLTESSADDLSSSDHLLKGQSPVDAVLTQQIFANAVPATPKQRFQQAIFSAAATPNAQRYQQLAWLQEVEAEAEGVSYDEGNAEGDEKNNAVDQAHTMLPGALSGANVIAIEMPEVEHQGTETAEPAEMAETGEVSTRSSRDAETGFWVQAQQGAVKEGQRRFTTTAIAREQTPLDLSQKHHARRSIHTDRVQKKKKKDLVDDSSPEDSLLRYMAKKGKSSTTTTTTSSLLDTPSEGLSSETPLPKKHERRSTKSDGTQKKKKHSDLLTEDAFVHYMTKFETTLKKTMAKEIAKKTARTVIKHMPKQTEGSEGHDSQPPLVLSNRSGLVHEDIICDCCDREIVGTRYICGNCPNYDLCEECENIQPSFHERSHVFIKLRRPCLKAGTHHGVRKPLLKRLVYEHMEEERKVDPGRVQVIMDRINAQGDKSGKRESRNNNNSEDGGREVNGQQKETEEEQQEEECRQEQYSAEFADERTFENDAIVQSAEKKCLNTGPDAWSTIAVDGECTSSLPVNPSDTDKDKPGAQFLTKHEEAAAKVDESATEKDVAALEIWIESSTAPAILSNTSSPLLDFFEYPLTPMQLKEEAHAATSEILDGDDLDSILELTDDGYVIYPTTKDGSTTSSPACLVKSSQPCQEIPETVLTPSQAAVADQEAVSEPSSLRAESPFTVASMDVEMLKASYHSSFLWKLVDADLQPPLTVHPGWSSGSEPDYQKEVLEKVSDGVSSLSSWSEESSSEEDFCVIVPDCFDVNKPLDPSSLAKLASQGTEKPHHSEHKRTKDSCTDIICDVVPDQLMKAETVNITSPAAGQQPQDSNHESQAETESQENEDKTSATNEENALLVQVEDSGKQPQDSSHESQAQTERHENVDETWVEDYTVDESAKVQEEAFAPVLGDARNEKEPTAADARNETTCASAASEMDRPTNQEQALDVADPSQQPSSCTSLKSAEFESEDEDQTNLKHPTDSGEEGAAAAADSISDPNQQLNQMMTNTIKKASSGLQQLFQTGKDIFKTWQTGDSYEYKESTYEYKPSEYKLPENTWQPSNKEYIPPKSNFQFVPSEYQLPKCNYSGPKSQVSAGQGFTGEYAGPLQRIREMGYFNNEHTLDLLSKHNGDIQKVVNEILEEADNDWAEKRHGDHF